MRRFDSAAWTSLATITLVVLTLVSLLILAVTIRPPWEWKQSLAERASVAQLAVSVTTIMAALAAVSAGTLRRQRLRITCLTDAGMGYVNYHLHLENVGASLANCRIEVRLQPMPKAASISSWGSLPEGWQRVDIGGPGGVDTHGWDYQTTSTVYAEQRIPGFVFSTNRERPQNIDEMNITWWGDRTGPHRLTLGRDDFRPPWRELIPYQARWRRAVRFVLRRKSRRPITGPLE